MPQKQERFVRMEINFILGKNGGYMPNTIGGRSIVLVRQADENLAVSKKFKIQQLQFKSMFRLFEWIYDTNTFVPIDIYDYYLKEMLL